MLGKSPAWADAGGACSGYLVEHDDFRLLMDCGTGVFGELRRHCDYGAVDAVLLSHLHPDHCVDLVPYAHALTIARGAPERIHLPLHTGPGTSGRLREIVGVLVDTELVDAAFAVTEYTVRTPWRIGPFTVCAAAVPHYIEAWALDLRDDSGSRFTFSADCGPNDALVTLARDTPLLLIEATLPEATLPEPAQSEPRGHLTAREAGEIGARARARRLLLTHYSDEVDGERLRREAAGAFGGDVELAEAGVTYRP